MQIVSAILFFILGYAAHVATPYAKAIIEKIITKGYEKLSKEIDRWH